MVKSKILILMIVIMLLLSSCGGSDKPETKDGPTSTPAPESIDGQRQGIGITAAPTPEVDEYDPLPVITNIVSNPQVVYHKTYLDLKRFRGRSIGKELAKRKTTPEGIKFPLVDESSVVLPFLKKFAEVEGMDVTKNQSLYMNFKSTANKYGIMFTAEPVYNAGILVDENGKPSLVIKDYVEDETVNWDDYKKLKEEDDDSGDATNIHYITIPIETDLVMQTDTYYNIYIAMSSDGIFKGMIWEEGKEANVTKFGMDISEHKDTGFLEQSWRLNLEISGPIEFFVNAYKYFVFDSYVE